MKDPLVSIVIINYNSYDYILDCINSLFNLEYKNFEIILVDNNSHDSSLNLVRKNFDNIKIIELKKNYGFAKGNNLAIPYTSGEFIILLNPDAIVDKNWLSELIKVAQKSDKIGIVGGKFYYSNKKIIRFGGSNIDKLGYACEFGNREKDLGYFNKEMESFFITGAGLLFKRTLYNKIGLFDPKYFLYYEDVDFCWRAWILGFKVIYNPNAIVYHNEDIKFKKRKYKNYYYYRERNRLRTILKNYELKTLISILPEYFLDKISEIRSKNYNRNLMINLILLNIKIIFWNIFHISSLIYHRKYIQSKRKRNDIFLVKLTNKLNKLRKEYH